MYVKLILENLYPDPYPSHSTNTYICEITITPTIAPNFLKKKKKLLRQECAVVLIVKT